MNKQKEEKQDDSRLDFEPLDLDVDDQFWENYQREQRSDQVRQARKLAQHAQNIADQPMTLDEDDRTDELDAFNALNQPATHTHNQNGTVQEELQTEQSLQRKRQKKKQTQHLNKNLKEKAGKTKNLDFEPLSQDNHIRVMHYFIYAVFYIFHFMISFKINFFIFPTIFILGGFIGLQKISKIILSRQAMSLNEASSTFAYIIVIYFFLYAIVAFAFSQNYWIVGYFYTPNILENIVLLIVSVFLGLKFFSDYELSTVLYITPFLTIFIFIISRLWVLRVLLPN